MVDPPAAPRASGVSDVPGASAGPANHDGPRKGSTINDVASVSGVSRGTVSRVLNGDRYVSPHARDAVLRAITTTGYVASSSARSLRTRRSDCVAVVLCGFGGRMRDDPNLSVLVQHAEAALAEHDITMVLMLADDDGQRRRVVRSARSGFVDGLVLVSPHAGDALLDAFDSPLLPVVVCGRPVGHETRLPFVTADDVTGARLAVRHLLAIGRRRIATITGPLDTPGGEDRHRSWREELGSLADDRLVVTAPEFSSFAGAQAMERLLLQAPDLDAVFVAADVMAVGAMETLRRAGRSVPEDVAVVGFDDSAAARTTSPALTTVRQPLDEVARALVRLLLRRINGTSAVDSLLVPTTLVRRGTA